MRDYLIAIDRATDTMIIEKEYEPGDTNSYREYADTERKYRDTSVDVLMVGANSWEDVRSGYSAFFPESKQRLNENLTKNGLAHLQLD